MKHQELLERLVQLMNLASKDETRSHLCGVHLQSSKEKNNLVLQVTDGHRAIREEVEVEDLDLSAFPKGILIYRDALPVMKLAVKNRMVVLQLLKEARAFKTLCGTFIPFSPIEQHNYPNLLNVMPRPKSVHKIGLNAQYILEIAKALGADKRAPNVCIEIDFSEGTDKDGNPTLKQSTIKPVWVKAKGREACLMPVRV